MGRLEQTPWFIKEMAKRVGCGGGCGWTGGCFLEDTGEYANPKHSHQEAQWLHTPLPLHLQEVELAGDSRSCLSRDGMEF